jgi:hypothetical protein
MVFRKSGQTHVRFLGKKIVGLKQKIIAEHNALELYNVYCKVIYKKELLKMIVSY